jgi:ornithine cyclodeaminase/alanine dehydrogenase-like protein (mu-crystallin family)
MILLTNDEIGKLLSMQMCLQSLERAYKDLASGKAVNRPRTDLYLPDTTPNGVYCFKSMEAGLVNEKVVAIRLNSDVIRWEERSGRIIKDKVPAASGNKWVGFILLFSAETGEPLGVFPDGIIQGLRVAASSGLAARFLSRTDSTVLGILGSGWQAHAHARAMCAVRNIQEIRVYSPTKVNREVFAHEMEQELQIPVKPLSTAEDVADGADILVAATNSVSRVIPPEWLKPGMHITCVKITELGEKTIARADRLVIHTRKFAPENFIAGLGDEKIEAHDPIEFLKGNRDAATIETPFWIGAPELKDIVASKAPGRQSPEEITCFNNNIGLGVQFAALAKVVYEQAKSMKVGREIPTDWFLEDVHP